MKGFLAITTTVAFLGMFAATTSAQRVSGVGSTPGFSNSQPTTPSINSANRRYDAPQVDYRTPAPSYNDKYGRNEPYRHDRDDRDRRGDDRDDDRRGGYGSRDDDRRGGYYGSRGDDRRRYEHRDNDRGCSCDKCHHHDDDRYESSRNRSSEYRDRGYVDYRDRDRNERSRGSSCPPKGKGKYGRD